MDVGIVLKFLSSLLFIITLWMLCPFAYSVYTDGADIVPFATSIGIGFFSSLVMMLLSYGSDLKKMGMREAIAAVAFSWIVASGVSGLPYWFHGCAPAYADAFFEAMSGFTTTGSTILADIDSVPRGLLLWRDLTHWLGGMGIIVLTLTIMPLIGVGGFFLYSSESTGMVHERMTPRVQETAVILWLIYLVLSVIQVILLLFGGLTFYDAVTYSMGSISTGGFAPHGKSVAYFDSDYAEWVLTFFMFISGANYALHYHVLRSRTPLTFFKDPEFTFYLLSVSFISLLLAVALYFSGTYGTFYQSLRFGAFQVVSLVTTTGFFSADYELWPGFCKALLFFCLFLGGCAGSTTGGLKHVRLLVLSKHVGRHAMRLLSPRAVIPLRLGDKSLDTNVVSACLAFFALYMFMFAAGTFLVTIYEPNLFVAMSGVACTLGNVGPGFGSIGPTGSFAEQTSEAKWIYSFLMMCGRLELYTVLVLFTGAFWSDGVIMPWSGRQQHD